MHRRQLHGNGGAAFQATSRDSGIREAVIPLIFTLIGKSNQLGASLLTAKSVGVLCCLTTKL